MRSICAAALLALPLAACSATGRWQKAGVTPAMAAADYAECRHAAEIAFRRDSDIDTDILASRGADWEKIGVLQTREGEYAASDNARQKDTVSRCMLDKGYSTGR
jgi:hypothetical protein